MKRLSIKINKWFDRLDEQWRDLPIKKQRYYTLLFLAVYVLLSIIVIAKVCYDVGKSDRKVKIEHIENPLIKQNKIPGSIQDSITTALKNRLYER